MNYNKQISLPIQIENSINAQMQEDLRTENAAKTYREMLSDPVISGSVSFIKSVLNKPFHLVPHVRATEKEKQVIKALNESLTNLQPYSFHRTLGHILSFIEYGGSLQEMVFERKNGIQVFSKFSPISMEQVNKFVYDKGELKKIILNPPINDGKIEQVTKQPTEIEGKKVLTYFFQADPTTAPLGKSMLNGCYTAYLEKKTLRELNLIAASKSLAGIASIDIPIEYLEQYYNEPSSNEAIIVENMLQQAQLLGQGKTSFIVKPSNIYGNGENQRMFDVQPMKAVDQHGDKLETSIARINREIYQCLQSSVLSMGQDSDTGAGSYGLSSTKNVLLMQFLKGVQDTIAAEFMKAVRVAFDLNGLTDERLPTIKFESLQEPTFEEFTAALKDIGMSGFVEPSGPVEEYIKQYLGWPAGSTGNTNAMSKARTKEQQGGSDNE